MAFIRTKKIGRKKYYYLVESYLKEGQVKQRVLKYLGKEIPLEYMSEYRKSGARKTSPETENPTRPPRVNSGEAKGDRHGG